MSTDGDEVISVAEQDEFLFPEAPEADVAYQVGLEIPPGIAALYETQKYSYIVTSLREAERLKAQLFAFPEEIVTLTVRPHVMLFCQKGSVTYFAAQLLASVRHQLGHGDERTLLRAILAHEN